MENNIEPCLFIIFGATGDLTNRKLMPALYKLEFEDLLHKDSKIIAFARKPKNNEEFRKEILKSIKKFSKLKFNNKIWKRLAEKIQYHQSEFQDIKGYHNLKKLIKNICARSAKSCNKIFYLAAPPSSFGLIVDNLKKSGLASSSKSWNRVVFEKPFGYDLKSAKNLNKGIKKAFKENQIYRIDHYLGKELVQNLMVLRFGNSIFEALWNKNHIDHVQISVSEDLGVGTRGGYYDKAGALRDMVQNHMMQLLSLTAMDVPKSLDADDIRDKKVEVLKAIKKYPYKDVRKMTVKGQYSSYKTEEKVSKDSKTETYAALKIFINDPRWDDVPFYLRTGKKLKKRAAEIHLVFKKNHNAIFSKYVESLAPNMLVIRIQPEEGISIQFVAKVPGKKMIIDTVRMDFCHECKFGPNTPEAYERLLHDVMVGDQTLFTRWDEVEYAWKFVDKIAKIWGEKQILRQYKDGSWGPEAADKLIEDDGRKWLKPEKSMYTELLENQNGNS